MSNTAETLQPPSYQPYQPDQKMLKNYADVFARFALNDQQGVQPGQVINVLCPDVAKPILLPLQDSILEAGGHMHLNYRPSGLARSFFEHANDEQLDFFSIPFAQAKIDMIDGLISIIAEADKHELEGIPADRIMRAGRASKPYREMFGKKEREGKLSWTLGLYGTEAMAEEADMPLEEYWEQIVLACFLDKPDPIGEWKHVFDENKRIRESLNALDIDQLYVEADDVDLRLTLGEQRQWLGGTGQNIPTFEIFTSPDWRGTNGTIHFNQPLYRYGNLITDVSLEFKDGIVVESSAEQNEEVLKEMLSQPNANRVGEFSLTDGRLSRITRFMAETLYDENVGGRYGNIHIAVGMSYTDAYTGYQASMEPEDFEDLGFNDPNCSVHTDIVSTTDRRVTATLRDGSKRVIYQDGQFTV